MAIPTPHDPSSNPSSNPLSGLPVYPSLTQTFTQTFTQSIDIIATPEQVERTFTELGLMQRWLNPMLVCTPVGQWSTAVGSRSQFVVKVPIGSLALENRVIDRAPGLVVWEFDGFFRGVDRWECHKIDIGIKAEIETRTRLTNCFSFDIPNPLIRFGFNAFAKRLTARDMTDQLHRLKTVAENLR